MSNGRLDLIEGEAKILRVFVERLIEREESQRNSQFIQEEYSLIIHKAVQT